VWLGLRRLQVSPDLAERPGHSDNPTQRPEGGPSQGGSPSGVCVS
jgi:hypothetical protein